VGQEHPPAQLHTPHKSESPPGYLHRIVRTWALPKDISLTPTQSLDLRTTRPTDTKIRTCLTVRPRAVLKAAPPREHFPWLNRHHTGHDQTKADVGCAD
jgi:hypothetical protein